MGGPNPLADMDRGGPDPLADLDRGVQIRGGSKSAVTPAPKLKIIWRECASLLQISTAQLPDERQNS